MGESYQRVPWGEPFFLRESTILRGRGRFGLGQNENFCRGGLNVGREYGVICASFDGIVGLLMIS